MALAYEDGSRGTQKKRWSADGMVAAQNPDCNDIGNTSHLIDLSIYLSVYLSIYLSIQ